MEYYSEAYYSYIKLPIYLKFFRFKPHVLKKLLKQVLPISQSSPNISNKQKILPFSLGPCSLFQHSAQINRFCLQLFTGTVGEQRKKLPVQIVAAAEWRKKHHSAAPENLSGATAVLFRDSVGRCGLCQPTRSTEMLHRSLSSPCPLFSASSAPKEVRTGKFKCMLFKNMLSSGLPWLYQKAKLPWNICRSCSPSLSWNFNVDPKGIFH